MRQADKDIVVNLIVQAKGLKTQVQQMQKQLSSIQVGIDAKIGTATQRGFANVSKSLSDTSKNAKDAEKHMIGLGRATLLAGRRFAAFSVAATPMYFLATSIRYALKEALQFDKELVRISQITGVTTRNLDSLAKIVDNLSVNWGISSSELTKVTVTLAQTGMSLKDIKIAMEAIAKSSLSATFDTMEKTVEGAIAIMHQFDISAEDLKTNLSAMNAVAKAFAVESDDLITAVRKAGGVFKTTNGTLEEFIALFTAVRSTTRESADTIATGFRTIFARLQRTRTIDLLRQFGIDLLDPLSGEFIGGYQAILKIGDAIKKIPAGSPALARIREELGGIRQLAKVIPLITQTEQAQKALAIATAAKNDIDEDAIKAQEALLVQFVKVREEFYKLGRDILKSDSIKFFIRQVLELTKAFISLVDTIKPALPLLLTVGTLRLFSIGKGMFAKKPTLMAGGGFAKGGKVPTLLTPGEVVFGPQESKRIGLDTLSRMNKMAFGGIVPGEGNHDTFPANLSPGSFVLRKRSAQKLGFTKMSGGGRVKLAGGNFAGYFFDKGGKLRRPNGKFASKAEIASYFWQQQMKNQPKAIAGPPSFPALGVSPMGGNAKRPLPIISSGPPIMMSGQSQRGATSQEYNNLIQAIIGSAKQKAEAGDTTLLNQINSQMRETEGASLNKALQKIADERQAIINERELVIKQMFPEKQLALPRLPNVPKLAYEPTIKPTATGVGPTTILPSGPVITAGNYGPTGTYQTLERNLPVRNIALPPPREKGATGKIVRVRSGVAPESSMYSLAGEYTPTRPVERAKPKIIRGFGEAAKTEQAATALRTQFNIASKVLEDLSTKSKSVDFKQSYEKIRFGLQSKLAVAKVKEQRMYQSGQGSIYGVAGEYDPVLAGHMGTGPLPGRAGFTQPLKMDDTVAKVIDKTEKAGYTTESYIKAVEQETTTIKKNSAFRSTLNRLFPNVVKSVEQASAEDIYLGKATAATQPKAPGLFRRAISAKGAGTAGLATAIAAPYVGMAVEKLGGGGVKAQAAGSAVTTGLSVGGSLAMVNPVLGIIAGVGAALFQFGSQVKQINEDLKSQKLTESVGRFSRAIESVQVSGQNYAVRRRTISGEFNIALRDIKEKIGTTPISQIGPSIQSDVETLYQGISEGMRQNNITGRIPEKNIQYVVGLRKMIASGQAAQYEALAEKLARARVGKFTPTQQYTASGAPITRDIEEYESKISIAKEEELRKMIVNVAEEEYSSMKKLVIAKNQEAMLLAKFNSAIYQANINFGLLVNRLTDISNAYQYYLSGMDDFDNRIKTITGELGQKAVSKDLSTLEYPTAVSTAQYRMALGNISQQFGLGGTAVQSLDIARAIERFAPNIIAKATGKGAETLDPTKDIVMPLRDLIGKQFGSSQLLEDMLYKFSQSIMSQSDVLTGPGGNVAASEVIKKGLADLGIDEYRTRLISAAKERLKVEQYFIDQMSILADQRQKYIDATVNVEQKRLEQAQLIAKLEYESGKRKSPNLSIAEAQSGMIRQGLTRTIGSGLTGGAVLNPRAIAEELKKRESRLPTLSPIQQESEKMIIQGLINQLKELQDSTVALTAAQEEGNRLESIKDKGLGLAERFYTGSRSEQREILKGAQYAQAVQNRQISMNQVPRKYRSSMMQVAGELSSDIGGRTPGDEMERFLMSMGIGAGLISPKLPGVIERNRRDQEILGSRRVEAAGALQGREQATLGDVATAIAQEQARIMKSFNESINAMQQVASTMDATSRNLMGARLEIVASKPIDIRIFGDQVFNQMEPWIKQIVTEQIVNNAQRFDSTKSPNMSTPSINFGGV